MLFHYALVDDLIPKEEFERRVEAKIDECGDLVDEPTAAMMVVGELGREHVKIKGLAAKSSLFSFFGKVVDKTDPKEFDRADGEKGFVATILLGDETGTVRVVLWDEKAGAVLDTAPGEVLEVIGRHPGKSTKEIYALALRKASCEIACTAVPNGSLSTEPVDLDVVILDIGEPRTFTRRDGSTGERTEAVVGDAAGTARIVAWAPELLDGVVPGNVMHIAGAKPNPRSEGREYSIDEKSALSPSSAEVTVPLTPPGRVGDTGTYSIAGTVKHVREPRSFTMRDGSASWVRNIVLSDGSDELTVVLWGEKALIPVHAGERVEVYNATAKAGRFGGIELGAGRGSAVRMPGAADRAISFTGTIICARGGTFIDNGTDRYLIDGDFVHGSEVHVEGTLAGNRIRPTGAVAAEPRAEDILARLRRLGAPE